VKARKNSTARAKGAARKAASTSLEPPFELTDAEVSEVLAMHRFKAGALDTEMEKCGSVLDDITYELEGLGEAVTHAINDVSHDNEQDARLMADACMAFARSLGDVAARLMRYCGRLEAFRCAEARAENAERMVEAHRDGTLGRPRPSIEVGLAGRRMREAEVSP